MILKMFKNVNITYMLKIDEKDKKWKNNFRNT